MDEATYTVLLGGPPDAGLVGPAVVLPSGAILSTVSRSRFRLIDDGRGEAQWSVDSVAGISYLFVKPGGGVFGIGSSGLFDLTPDLDLDPTTEPLELPDDLDLGAVRAVNHRPGHILVLDTSSGRTIHIDVEQRSVRTLAPWSADGGADEFSTPALLADGRVFFAWIPAEDDDEQPPDGQAPSDPNAANDDNDRVLAAVWDPSTERWTPFETSSEGPAPHTVDLEQFADGRVYVHRDSLDTTSRRWFDPPPPMFAPNAPTASAGDDSERPRIEALSRLQIRPGGLLVAQLGSAMPITRATLSKTGEVRGRTTTDRRFVEVLVRLADRRLEFDLPSDAAVLSAGRYLLTVFGPDGAMSTPVALDVVPYHRVDEFLGPIVGPVGGVPFQLIADVGDQVRSVSSTVWGGSTDLSVATVGGRRHAVTGSAADADVEVTARFVGGDVRAVNLVRRASKAVAVYFQIDDDTYLAGLPIDYDDDALVTIDRTQRFAGFRGRMEGDRVVSLGVAVRPDGSTSAGPQPGNGVALGPVIAEQVPADPVQTQALDLARVTGVDVRSGEIVDGIQLITDHGPLERLGGPGGDLRTIRLYEGEHIVSIVASVERYENLPTPTSMIVRTDMQRSLGPFGTRSGSPGSRVELNAPTGSEIVGLRGSRQGPFLRSLGVIVRSIASGTPSTTPPVGGPHVPDPTPEPGPAPDPDPAPATGAIELGEVVVETMRDGSWSRVDFEQPFDAPPIVVATPLLEELSAPGFVRIRNVTESGFEARIEEIEGLSDTRREELFHYLAVDEGQHDLGGLRMVAWRQEHDGPRTQYSLPPGVSPVPIPAVLGQLASAVDETPAMARITGVDGLGVVLEVDRAGWGTSEVREMVHMIAIESGLGTIDGRPLNAIIGREVARSTSISFDRQFATPRVFATPIGERNTGPRLLEIEDTSQDAVRLGVVVSPGASIETEVVSVVVIG